MKNPRWVNALIEEIVEQTELNCEEQDRPDTLMSAVTACLQSIGMSARKAFVAFKRWLSDVRTSLGLPPAPSTEKSRTTIFVTDARHWFVLATN